ncbi:twin-arginine translocase TatA/TatE family subunit [Streptomyces cavernae]|uniref:twin-arginine translocase TatA/TatE family subunit n=1 Tax=Streptomyces cavernae TaxID=2259034 RepID=UPI000FEBAE4E|nr:twin-arginine translocase TatA/TatE family subunit [Streptomyces cavernae]
MFGLSELALILLVVIVALGVKKGPELIRSAGRATRVFKSEAKALRDPRAGTAPRVVPGTVVGRDDPAAPRA